MPTLFKIQQPRSHNQLQSDPYLYDTFLDTTLSTTSPVINLPPKIRPYAINIHIAQRAETAADGRKVILRNVDVQTVS
jgi:aminopeptidase C